MNIKLKFLAGLLSCLLLSAPLSAQRSDALDDVLQYVPYASLFAMKAAGVDSRHQWPQLAVTAAASWVATAGVSYVLKHTVREWRPDDSDRRSFPSGHTAFAFAGATALRHEFGKVSPWIAVGGYALATAVAVDRVRRDRHYWHDVGAGAVIGVLATEATYYLSERLFDAKQVAVSVAPAGLSLAYRW